MRWVSCMAAIAALAFAGPAAALTLVFDVNVTSAQGVAGFTPFSFQQAWTFGPGVLTFSSSGSTFTLGLEGPASAGPSPDGFDASASPFAHLGALSASGTYDFESGAVTSTFTTFAALRAFEQTQLVIPLGSSTQLVRYQSTRLDAANSGAFPTQWLYSPSEAGLAAYIAAAGPIAWRDEAGERISVGGGASFDLARRVYVGTATLAPPPVSVVPEPAAWALMIAGFALCGAVARRRQAGLRIGTSEIYRDLGGGADTANR